VSPLDGVTRGVRLPPTAPARDATVYFGSSHTLYLTILYFLWEHTCIQYMHPRDSCRDCASLPYLGNQRLPDLLTYLRTYLHQILDKARCRPGKMCGSRVSPTSRGEKFSDDQIHARDTQNYSSATNEQLHKCSSGAAARVSAARVWNLDGCCSTSHLHHHCLSFAVATRRTSLLQSLLSVAVSL